MRKPPRFNAYYSIDEVKPVDGSRWRLELSGRIADKRPWTAAELLALPQQEMIIRHICVEGWDYIGQWSGVNLRQFLERVGADLKARYVAFRCAEIPVGLPDAQQLIVVDKDVNGRIKTKEIMQVLFSLLEGSDQTAFRAS